MYTTFDLNSGQVFSFLCSIILFAEIQLSVKLKHKINGILRSIGLQIDAKPIIAYISNSLISNVILHLLMHCCWFHQLIPIQILVQDELEETKVQQVLHNIQKCKLICTRFKYFLVSTVYCQ